MQTLAKKCVAKDVLHSTEDVQIQQTIYPVSHPVDLRGRGERPFVLGLEKTPLTSQQYDVIQLLIQAGDRGLGKEELTAKSGHGDAVNILKRLAKADDGWRRVIQLPGISGRRYRVRSR